MWEGDGLMPLGGRVRVIPNLYSVSLFLFSLHSLSLTLFSVDTFLGHLLDLFFLIIVNI